MSNLCFACGYPALEKPPYVISEGRGIPSNETCPSCGFQYGKTDREAGITYAQWRIKWFEKGMPWQSSTVAQPPNWNPQEQLSNVGIKVSENRINNMCPVCGYLGLDKPAYVGAPEQGSPSHEICPSCDFQFGWTDMDQHMSFQQWRESWVAAGMPWAIKEIDKPLGWNPREQLKNIGIEI